MRIYLSGAIQGYGFEEANSWRECATKIFKEKGHSVLNPLRNRMWKEAKEQKYFNINELVHRDFLDVQKCDVLLVEMTNTQRNYVGTVAEMTLAREVYRKPIVVFVGERIDAENGDRYSFWVDYLATAVVRTLEEACEYICNVLDYDNIGED